MSEQPANTESELIEQIRAVDVRAPESLHRRTAELIAAHSSRSSSSSGARAIPSRRWLGGGLAAVAVVVLALVLSSSGGRHALSWREASAATLKAATSSAPTESPRARQQLSASVDGIAFPYWGGRLGWRSTGERSDRIAGRTVNTVFYGNAHGQRIGYAIVAGTPAPRLSGGTVSWHDGTPYHLLSDDGSNIVSWLRHGRLCIVAGRGVSTATLLRLASWDDRGTPA